MKNPIEVSWFSALCDDDYEFLGQPDPMLASSWEHCRNIVLGAEKGGFDNILLPSGYALGVDTLAFAAGIAPMLKRMRLLAAIRCGEVWPAQLARQISTIDQMLGGRLAINIISSDMPGETLASAPRYRRTVEVMHLLRALLNGEAVDFDGDGQLSPVEFGYLVSPSVPFKNVTRKFDKLDTDDSGFLSKDEFRKPKATDL